MNSDGIDARRAALQLFTGVVRKKQPLDLLMAETPQFSGLTDRDRAFARNLTATALRRLGQIDAVLGGFLEKPLGPSAAAVTDILRLGAAQVLFTGTADHAALDTAVDMVRRAGHPRFDKLVNAVLRRTQREGADFAVHQDAARLNTPDWLWRSWEGAYGAETCRRIAEAHLTPAPLDITVKQDPAGWAEKLSGMAAGGNTVRLPAGTSVPSLPGFGDGAWWVQDLAAALPVATLGDVSGAYVLDLCAAPGGKTAQLAAKGATVTAIDRSAPRMARLAENMARLGLRADTHVADAGDWTPGRTFDIVLLDAPCSATGTIRRHPDLPHTKTTEDVRKLAGFQEHLLRRAAGWVRPGGVLVFAVCSLEPEEGTAHIDGFLAEHADFDMNPLSEAFAETPAWIDDRGCLRTLPCHNSATGGMDGFFAVKFRRRA